jgi:invasion protein IalB
MPHYERLLPTAGCLLAAAFAAMVAGPALAQSKAPAKADAATAAASKIKPPEWIKICGKDPQNGAELCGTENYLMAEAGNVVGQIRVLDVKNGKESKRVFAVQIPEGLLIQPGVNLVIDNDKTPIKGKYTVCFPNGCVAEVPMSDAALGQLKRGSELTLFAANPQGKWVGAKASLAGFTKAYDGPSADPKTYQAMRKAFMDKQNELQAALLKRADEQRKKLEKDGKDGQSEAAPAPAPAPAPGLKH